MDKYSQLATLRRELTFARKAVAEASQLATGCTPDETLRLRIAAYEKWQQLEIMSQNP